MTISRLHSLPRPLAAILATAAITVLVLLILGAAPAAHAARARPRYTSCDISNVATRLGPTSVTSLKVLHVRCGVGISVVRAFHACRLANGPSGRCVKLVKGYACREQRTSSPAQFNATVTCSKDRKSVVHRYTQVLS
jgi:SH3-like domain-containing protein